MFDQDFIVADFSFDKRIYWKHYQHFMWKKKDGFISGCVCVLSEWPLAMTERAWGKTCSTLLISDVSHLWGWMVKLKGSPVMMSQRWRNNASAVFRVCVSWIKGLFFWWWFMQTIKKPDGLITQNHSAWGHSHRQAKRKTDWLTKANSLANVWHTSCKKFEGIMQQPYPFSIQGNTSICTVLVKGYRCIRSDALLRLKWISTQISV